MIIIAEVYIQVIYEKHLNVILNNLLIDLDKIMTVIDPKIN